MIPKLATALLATAYVSGRATYQRHVIRAKRERGFYVEVPTYYDRARSARTSLYVRTLDPFRAARPSVIFFEGGPGGDCHGEPYQLLEMRDKFNVILFDPRGVSFSRPDELATFEDPRFYSSVHTARDAEIIRKSLGIESWSVFGASYGTVPATIYASLFPKRTRALVLTSTVFSRDSSDRSQQRMIAHYAKSAALENFLRERALPLTAPLTQRGETHAIENWIERTLTDEGSFALPWLVRSLVRSSRRNNVSRQVPRAKPPPSVSARVDITDRKVLTRTTRADARLNMTDFPISAPVTYIQGNADARCPPGETVRHMKSVARGFAQVIFVKGAGHHAIRSPTSFDLLESRFALSTEVLEAALTGQDLRQTTAWACETHLDRFAYASKAPDSSGN